MKCDICDIREAKYDYILNVTCESETCQFKALMQILTDDQKAEYMEKDMGDVIHFFEDERGTI